MYVAALVYNHFVADKIKQFVSLVDLAFVWLIYLVATSRCSRVAEACVGISSKQVS